VQCANLSKGDFRQSGLVYGRRIVLTAIISLHCISNNLVGCSLVRIVEEELIAVGIIDNQKPVAPPAVLDRSAFGFEFSPQRIQGRDRGLLGLRLDVQGDEHQPFADLLGPLAAEDERAAPPVHLGDERLAVLLEAPGAREAEPVHVEAERGLNVRILLRGRSAPGCQRVERGGRTSLS
jgi:hypothetical protein